MIIFLAAAFIMYVILSIRERRSLHREHMADWIVIWLLLCVIMSELLWH